MAGMTETEKPGRLNANIDAATEAALAFLVDREGVTITEATRRLVSYGLLYYQAVTDQAEVLFRRGDQIERVIILA